MFDKAIVLPPMKNNGVGRLPCDNAIVARKKGKKKVRTFFLPGYKKVTEQGKAFGSISLRSMMEGQPDRFVQGPYPVQQVHRIPFNVIVFPDGYHVDPFQIRVRQISGHHTLLHLLHCGFAGAQIKAGVPGKSGLDPPLHAVATFRQDLLQPGR
jgi:hypothetical protein